VEEGGGKNLGRVGRWRTRQGGEVDDSAARDCWWHRIGEGEEKVQKMIVITG